MPAGSTAGGSGGYRPFVDTNGCCQHDGLALLYVAISPRRPPRNGRIPGRQGLRRRLETHYTGNAEGSTLRKTLGCLLAGESAWSCAVWGHAAAARSPLASLSCPHGWRRTPG